MKFRVRHIFDILGIRRNFFRLTSCNLPTSKRRIGCTTYGREIFPTFEVVYKIRPRMTGEEAQRRDTAFDQVVDGASELSDTPDFPDVPDDVGILERKDQVIWDFKELFAPASGDAAVKSAMESLNAKLTADRK